MTGLSGRVALVTGGSRGIGRAICEVLGSEGVRVAVNYRMDGEAAEATAELVRNAGGEAITIQGDMGEANDIERVVHTTRSKLGPVELLSTTPPIRVCSRSRT